jgi:hypothetical protein
LLQRHVVDFILSLQLDDVHLLVKTERAVQTPHAPVEQLIEIHIAVNRTHAHLQHYFFELVVGGLWGQTERRRQRSEKVIQLFFAHLNTTVASHSELNPRLHKQLQIFREFLNRVVIRDVVSLELGDDHQNKQVQHYILHEKHENDVE